MNMKRSGDSWRWTAGDGSFTARPSITITELSDEAKAERQKKIDAGARVLPFGFARVLVEDEDA